MDRNDKLIPLSPDGKAKVLRKLEGSIYFQKILTKTDVHRKMTVPHWFVEEHGDMIRRSILLRTVSSKQSWTVTLNISIREVTQVRVVGGWKEFVTFHGLTKGDLLIFALTEISEFEVHLYREKGCNCRDSHSQPSTSRKLDDAKISLKKAEQPDEHLGAPGRTKSSGTITRRKATVGEESCAVFGSGHGSSSCSIDLKLRSDLGKFKGGDSPDGCSHDAHTAQDVAVVHSRCDLKPKCDTPVCPAEQNVSRMREDNLQQAFPSLMESPQPSFFKKLTVTSFSNTRMGLKNGILVSFLASKTMESWTLGMCLFGHRALPDMHQMYRIFMNALGYGDFQELPTTFWKSFCKDIHSLVKLQGIGEDSPVRTVTCARHRCANKNWRIRLTNGWRDFAMENKLEVNQVLEFTLAGDSFFVVRRVDS